MTYRLFTILFLAVLTACASSNDPFSSSADFSPYTAVYVAPVEISEELLARTNLRTGRLPGDRDRPISERDLNEKAGDLRRILVTELQRRKSIAPEPGPGVITIQATLTDLEASRPTQADYQAKPGLSFQSEYTGRAAANFVLSSSGEVIATFSDSYDGQLDDSRRIGTWADADFAFRRWARKLASALS